ncbi:holin [Corynebacterium mastitidis]|uniref:holin n=1 Tax=Corynebacterium mastitidis TaxID=161890 RepID=UPI00255127D5|nr:holin [Corynebacterium mastitidis]MDK8451005.1 holin [Corynebacterium mastitidis]
MRTRSFWIDTAERAVKTLAQALIAVLAVGTPIYEIAWVEALGIAATAAVISVLTSIASVGVGEPGTAAAVPTRAHEED